MPRKKTAAPTAEASSDAAPASAPAPAAKARARGRRQAAAELSSVSDPRAPLDAAAFLRAATGVVRLLEADLLERAKSSPAVQAALTLEHETETKAGRIGEPFDVWLRGWVTQVAVAWILGCVFVRTLEDRGLLKENRLAGPGATDVQKSFGALAPSLTERDYLAFVFRELSRFEATRDLFDERHNPIHKLAPSAAGAQALLRLFREPNPEAPAFRFGGADTRFLGDLYQDLSEFIRDKYALLQTPVFVEEYILERTLERAIARFGLDDTTLIDPTCGSGHFLLGAFERLVDHRLRNEPGLDLRQAAQKALDAIAGVDINPYAVAIARFRLTLAFLEKGGWDKIASAPAPKLHLAVADSLLVNPQRGQQLLAHVQGTAAEAWEGEPFRLDDPEAARDVLGRTYAAVVGNPPYITVKDAKLRETYRATYTSAAGKYSLAAPFLERFFELARPAGYVGTITANSFMKREFGKRLIEKCLPRWNIDGVVNTAGAYIPGHGTPTVLLFGTHEEPVGDDVLSVLAKRGEPTTPEDAAKGLVWRSIVEHGGELGFENDYISVARVARSSLGKHPWSLGGGGAAELKELLEERADLALSTLAESIGVGGMSNADDIYWASPGTLVRLGVDPKLVRPVVIGEELRDWSHHCSLEAFFPYEPKALDLAVPVGRTLTFLWPFRTTLGSRVVFGGATYVDAGRPWWEWHQVTKERYRTPLSVAFAFVATHNHFVLDRGGSVLTRSAPIIKLKEGATEDDHLALLAYLNSSTACFWMKQVFFDKGNRGEGGGTTAETWEKFFEFDGTKLRQLPIPSLREDQRLKCVELARALLNDAEERSRLSSPQRVFDQSLDAAHLDTTIARISSNIANVESRMRATQEALDWFWYGVLELAPEVATAAVIEPGWRASDVLFARAVAEGEVGRRYFDLCRLPAPEEIASLRLPDSTLDRMAAIAASPHLGLLETPSNKRTFREGFRTPDWRGSARDWLAGQLELVFQGAAQPKSQKVLLDTAFQAAPAAAVLTWLSGPDLPVAPTVSAVLQAQSMAFLAAFRYSEAGLEKRAAWERVWDLQRAEDRGESVPPFDPPPKYDQKDYRDANGWRLRGKLDVPKERFISYPGCESDEDKEPVYGWAGWNHLQQAQALAALYEQRKAEGWTKERLTPMLAGILELTPWVKQWHNEPDSAFGGLRMGDYFDEYLSGELSALGLTREELRAWRPAIGATARKRLKRGT